MKKEQNDKKVKVCFFGTYDRSYSSNQIVLRGLELNHVPVEEVHVNIPITKLNTNADMGPLTLIKRLLNKFKIIPVALSKWKKIKECNVMYVGYPGHFDIFTAWIIARILRMKLVFYPLIILTVTFTDDIVLLNTSPLKLKLLKMIEKLVYALPDMIITDGPYQKDIFIKQYGVKPEKLKDIPIGADDRIYKYSYHDRTPDSFKVIYYGLYSPLHGVEHIIDAAKICEKDPQIQFLMIGNGKTFKENHEKAQKLNLKNMIFYSEMTEANSYETISQGDIFLGIFSNSPTVARQIPNKVYQGLALGKTVVTGESKVIQHYFTDKKNIILCKVADGKALAEQLINLKNNSALCENVAKEGYKLFQEQFTPKAIGKELISIIKQIN